MKRILFIPKKASLTMGVSSFTSTLSIQSTPWNNAFLLPKFDATLGVLWRIELELSQTARSISRIENTTAVSGVNVESGADCTLTVTDASSNTLFSNVVRVSFTNNLGPYDGLPDYGGSSGVSNARRTRTGQKATSIARPFDDFIGTGDITLSIDATAVGFCTGLSSFLLAVTPEIGTSITIRYHYIENLLPTIISGTIWDDYNGNGVMEPGEPGLAGVILSLLDEFGSPTAIPNATTDADGYYEFTGLTAGNYYVVYELPSGYTVTNDLDGVDGSNSMFVTVTGGQTTSANVGMMIPPPPVVSGIIWEDTDGDGIIGISETRLSGITVSLLDEAGVPTGLTATSDVDGIYTFNLPSAGNYKISYTVPDGYITTYDYDGVDLNNQFAFTANNGEVIDLFHIGFQLVP
jgi:hypothetical protein